MSTLKQLKHIQKQRTQRLKSLDLKEQRGLSGFTRSCIYLDKLTQKIMRIEQALANRKTGNYK